MALPVIEPYIHRCRGTGNSDPEEHAVIVEPFEVEHGYRCTNCGDALATPAQIAAHIYAQLRP